MIDNKELRKFIIYFTSGSIRSLEPAFDYPLRLDFDKMGSKVICFYEGPDGELVTEEITSNKL
jgi:hypothetical protein